MGTYRDHGDVTSPGSDWEPPVFDSSDIVAVYAVKSMPEGQVATLETSCPSQTDLAGWLRRWLLQRMPAVRRRAEEVTDYQFAFMYMVVKAVDVAVAACDKHNWKVAEFGHGSAPQAPEEWPELDLADLMDFAVADLQLREA
jgi:hypothetical protein